MQRKLLISSVLPAPRFIKFLKTKGPRDTPIFMNEHEWPADAIEVQLAHANGGSVRGIYNHAQYLDKRREMMQWWADWLDEKVE